MKLYIYIPIERVRIKCNLRCCCWNCVLYVTVRCTVAVLTLQHTATDRSDDQTIRYAMTHAFSSGCNARGAPS